MLYAVCCAHVHPAVLAVGSAPSTTHTRQRHRHRDTQTHDSKAKHTHPAVSRPTRVAHTHTSHTHTMCTVCNAVPYDVCIVHHVCAHVHGPMPCHLMAGPPDAVAPARGPVCGRGPVGREARAGAGARASARTHDEITTSHTHAQCRISPWPLGLAALRCWCLKLISF
jgi:hypothetical protein